MDAPHDPTAEAVPASDRCAPAEEPRRRPLLGDARVGRRRWLAGSAAGLLGALTLASCSPGSADAQHASTSGNKATTTTATTAATTAAPNDCPLTGAPVPGGGGVPHRAPIAFKVDNYPTARPQSGLDKADVVFEEPVEGGITRYVAIFQCQGAKLVGPVRSARNIDIGILGQLGHPLLVHVGGIQPVLANIAKSPLVNFDLGAHTSVITHVPGRYAPYDTYTTPTAVWGQEKTKTTVPNPLFSYSSSVPSGTAVSAVSIPFSSYSEVHWHYDTSTKRFTRYFGTTPDTLSTGTQNSAANVVVQFVHVTYGPWMENSTGGLEVQANLYTNASGQALVFRNGVEVKGKWSRSSLSQPTKFTTTGGSTISLQPGNTWVELVPSTISVTTTPAG